MAKIKILPPKLRKIFLQKDLFKICAKNDVIFLALFGSFAKERENQKSDIDLLIKFDENTQKSLLDLVRLEDELTKLYQRKVDLLTPESISPYLRKEILNSSLIIYEKR